MKIKKITINNFKSLKDFSIDLEDELSLIIGKNNTGKTSVVEALRKFLDNEQIKSEDFSISYLEKLEEDVKNISYKFEKQGIKLKIFIKYDENDNLSNISKFITNLDENNNYIILDFEYILNEESFDRLRSDYNIFSNENNEKSFEYFFKRNYKKYYKRIKRSIDYDLNEEKENEDIYIDIENDKEIKRLINLKYISAKRAVDNRDTNNTLSIQSANYFERIKEKFEVNEDLINFEEELERADNKIDESYDKIFKDVIKKVEKFGKIKGENLNIKIKSSLQQSNILKGNTTVLYNYKEQLALPENYNGLGYLNLISIIFEIEIIINDFCKDDKSSDINLLFIEEPEAHTHPQMQYIFINNIKELLNESKNEKEINLQTIITTHSPHIVAQSDFNDIKYFNKNNIEGTWCKSLKNLEKKYASEKESYKFLKQYLTLNSSEIFFADKIIFIEGDTERILLPAILKKIDLESKKDEEKLLSQNISIIEVGCHSKIFDKFIDFIQIKTLVLTDIDAVEKNEENKYIACEVEKKEALRTSNASIKHYFKQYINDENNSLSVLKNLKTNDRILKKNKGGWEKDEDGGLMIQYQLKEELVKYYPRTFEDAFICINENFILSTIDKFESLKNKEEIRNKIESEKFYAIVQDCIDSKPSFAIEILLNSEDNYSNWNIPRYIKEGLEWLKK